MKMGERSTSEYLKARRWTFVAKADGSFYYENRWRSPAGSETSEPIALKAQQDADAALLSAVLPVVQAAVESVTGEDRYGDTRVNLSRSVHALPPEVREQIARLAKEAAA